MKSDPPPGKIVVGHTLKSTLRLADWSKIRLGIPRAADVALPAFYCATVDYVTAIAALEQPLRDLECPSIESNSRFYIT